MGTIIFDFDGTFTDINEESKDFIDVFSQEVRKITRLEEKDFLELRAQAIANIESNLQQYGWEFRDRIIAPAKIDPYVYNTVINQQILKHLSIENDMSQAFRTAYGHSTTCFKPYAKEVIEELGARNELYIVTNSSEDKVTRKLCSLNLKTPVTVKGNAMKFVLDDTWTDVPESVDKGFGRPCYLRRKQYFDVLDSIPDSRRSTVIGDVYELDLLLPQYLGMDIIGIQSPCLSEPESEVMCKEGRIIKGLDELLSIDYR